MSHYSNICPRVKCRNGRAPPISAHFHTWLYGNSMPQVSFLDTDDVGPQPTQLGLNLLIPTIDLLDVMDGAGSARA